MEPSRQAIYDLVRDKRPTASENTLKTYTSMLSSVAKKLALDRINDYTTQKERIIKYAESVPSGQTAKTILSALFVITGEKEYRDAMIARAEKVKNEYKEQRTNPERLRDMPSLDEIKAKYEIYKAKIQAPRSSMDDWVDFFICAVCCGKLLPPRRNLDWTEMRIRNADKKRHNYMDATHFVFNIFKMAKFKSEEERKVPIPEELRPFLNKWKKINAESDHLLCNTSTGAPLTTSQMTKRVQKIFGKKVGVDVIRSIYLSDLYKGLPKLTELEETAQQMGHTVSSAMQYYVKKDD